MRSLYITATGQHVGKTTIALGLLSVLEERGVSCQYFKPVGQHYREYEGLCVDTDAWLCREVTGTDVSADLLSPVVVPPGFVADYLERPEPDALRDRINQSAARLLQDVEMLVVEGTGHAGVGSCLDVSNAAVARLLDSVAVIVVPGGIGSSLDEVALSMALFEREGVAVAGVIANKVFREKAEKVRTSLALGLERFGTRLLGAIPYEPALSYPSVAQIREELDARVLFGEDALSTPVENTIIAAMTPPNVLRYLEQGALVITPGDRVDNILLAMSANGLYGPKSPRAIVGLVLTGGLIPHVAVMPLLKNSGLPVLICQEDTYSVAAKIAQRVFKINPGDTEKITAAQGFVRDYVDVEAIMAAVA
ncbi:MAG: phosphotransacetylase family protein [Planctomycetota bacterium]|jgi:BioD-like phosphotransacetylase family protein